MIRLSKLYLNQLYIQISAIDVCVCVCVMCDDIWVPKKAFQREIMLSISYMWQNISMICEQSWLVLPFSSSTFTMSYGGCPQRRLSDKGSCHQICLQSSKHILMQEKKIPASCPDLYFHASAGTQTENKQVHKWTSK